MNDVFVYPSKGFYITFSDSYSNELNSFSDSFELVENVDLARVGLFLSLMTLSKELTKIEYNS